jgi:hypothetical protein
MTMRKTGREGHLVVEDLDADPTQQALGDLFSWEKVYIWAMAHPVAPWIAKSTGYGEIRKIEAIGRSNNQLYCPLACYLNEVWPVPEDWEIGGYGDILRTVWEDDEPWVEPVSSTEHYAMPDWAEDVMRKVDEIGREGETPAIQVWISQQTFLQILESVKPN